MTLINQCITYKARAKAGSFTINPEQVEEFYIKQPSHFIIQSMRKLDKLIASYEKAQSIAYERLRKVKDYSDGYKYVTCLRVWGSLTYDYHKNEYSVQNLCDEYSGENGIVEVMTTNPTPNISTYGSIRIVTEDELANLAKDDISMSKAITNIYASLVMEKS